MSSETNRDGTVILPDKSTVETFSETSVQADDSEHQNGADDSTGTNQNHDPQQSQPESTNTENKNFFKGWKKTIFGDDSSNIKVTFHVYLPSFEFFEGYPIVVDPISIPLERFNNYEVKYKYAFFIPKPKIEEKSKFSLFTKSKSDKNEDALDKKKKNNNDENNNPDDSSVTQESREDGEDQENNNKNKNDEKKEDGDDKANDPKKSKFSLFTKSKSDKNEDALDKKKKNNNDENNNPDDSSVTQESREDGEDQENNNKNKNDEKKEDGDDKANDPKKSKFSLFTKSKSDKNEDALDKKKKNNNDENNNPDDSSVTRESREDGEDQENNNKNKNDEKKEDGDDKANDPKNKVNNDNNEDENEGVNESKNKKDKKKKDEKNENEDEEANDSKNKKSKDGKNKEEGDLYSEENEPLRLLEKKTGFKFDIAQNLSIYSNIGKWLFYNCNSFEILLFVWTDMIEHTTERDIQLLKYFCPRVEQLISSSHATSLNNYFSRMPIELRVEVAGIFRNRSLSLLNDRLKEWNKSDSESILQILKDPQLKWSKDDFLEAMKYISGSPKPGLLSIFPNLLDYWFKSDFKNFKTNKLPDICKTWYYHLIDINRTGSYDSNDSNFIYEIYHNLSIIFPIIGKHSKIFKDLLDLSQL
ncbi:unnamed protein product [Rhizophagus irregularis]|nr:unnamed protein product [Rhizophagus irregularis]